MIAKALTPSRVFGYGRTSKDDSFQHWSPLAQKDKIEKHVAYWLTETEDGQPLQFVGCSFDANVSGSTPIRQRPSGQNMDRQLRQGDHIVIASLDRAFRNAADAAVTLANWKTRGITLHVIREGLDTSKAFGGFMAQLMALVAAFELELQKERRTTVTNYQRANALPAGRCAPIGWVILGKRHLRRFCPCPIQRAYAAACVALHTKHKRSLYRAREEAIKTLGPWKGRELTEYVQLRLINAHKAGFPLPGGMTEASHPEMFRDPKWKRKLLMAEESCEETHSSDVPDSAPISDLDNGATPPSP